MIAVGSGQYNEEIYGWLQKVFGYAEYLSKQKLTPRNCPVCGSADNSFYANNDYLDYCLCGACSLVFMNPSVVCDKIQDGFRGADELLLEYFAITARYRCPEEGCPDPMTDDKLLDIYKIRRSGSLLDVGCSFGDFLRKAKHFYEIEGVEVNPYTASIAAKEFTIHRDYLAELKLDKRYDIVTLHQILYGVPDPVALCRDIHAILKNDGILYVNTPNADSYAMQLYRGKANHLYGYTSQNVFNRRSLEKLAELTGFRIRSFRTEWLDIYQADLLQFLDDANAFVHKKNIYIPGYEEKIALEEEMQRRLGLDLGERGNYLVAVLEKQ
jgi:SAM-dependent methyltransferase